MFSLVSNVKNENWKSNYHFRSWAFDSFVCLCHLLPEYPTLFLRDSTQRSKKSDYFFFLTNKTKIWSPILWYASRWGADIYTVSDSLGFIFSLLQNEKITISCPSHLNLTPYLMSISFNWKHKKRPKSDFWLFSTSLLREPETQQKGEFCSRWDRTKLSAYYSWALPQTYCISWWPNATSRLEKSSTSWCSSWLPCQK